MIGFSTLFSFEGANNENPVLESWKANPVVMAFGEVPTALESGVIDGLMTSIGGWLSVRQQAPYYTTGGAGVFTGDYYMVSASRRWWDRLTPATRRARPRGRRGCDRFGRATRADGRRRRR